MGIQFQVTEGVLEVIDEIENQDQTLLVNGIESVTPIQPDRFFYPVDDAVELSSRQIVCKGSSSASILDGKGEYVQYISPDSFYQSPSDDSYIISLNSSLHIYFEFEGTFSAKATDEKLELTFDSPTTVYVGARSSHKHPDSIITTTSNPIDMMIAISHFGSALKTTSPERSFPTLRGHPPSIELGDELKIPEELTVPETGIEIGVPPDYGSIFMSAPLAYYLAAGVVSSEEPYIKTGTDFKYSLKRGMAWEDELERAFRQIFFFDCITRTEGYYQVDLHERERVDEIINIDFADLYSKPIGKQVEEYLHVPYELVEEFIPNWQNTVSLPAEPDQISTVPHIVDRLAVIKSDSKTRASSLPKQQEIASFARGSSERTSITDPISSQLSQSQVPAEPVVEQHEGSRISKINVLEKLDKAAFKERLISPGTTGDGLSVAKVGDPNDRPIHDGFLRSWTQPKPSISVDQYLSLTVEELNEVLASNYDFLQFFGKVSGEGFSCIDGILSWDQITSVGVNVFYLSSDVFPESERNLVQLGARGGVVETSGKSDKSFTKIGWTVIRLMNDGFPLRDALDIADFHYDQGGNYIIVGDGGVTLRSAGIPILLKISANGSDGTYEVDIQTYASDLNRAGAILQPLLGKEGEYILSPGSLKTYRMTEDELESFIQHASIPMLYNEKLLWSNDIETLSEF